MISDEHKFNEICLLKNGRSLDEVSCITGRTRTSIYSRNKKEYCINLDEAFASRIAREGFPVRLPDDTHFMSWFSGLFDGEGSIGFWKRTRRDGLKQHILTVKITLRADDLPALLAIQNVIGGRINNGKPRGMDRRQNTWWMERVEDLQEVIVPMFDRHPLRTKKSREFTMWKEFVGLRYMATNGGSIRNKTWAPEHNDRFDQYQSLIANSRRWEDGRNA